MKDIASAKIIRYLNMLNDQKRKCTLKYGWMEKVRYCEQIQNILMFAWLTGGLDHEEYKKLCKKYKVTNKDLRKIIYTADIETDLEVI